MIPKFDIKEFEKIKNVDIIFECEICGTNFNSTKKYLRRALGITKCSRPPSLKYCSKKCYSKGQVTGKYIKCDSCGTDKYKTLREIKRNKSGFFYCGYKCKGTHWNQNKNYGFNRSKLEIWIESKIKNKYDFDILFNDRSLLSNYELDIYIPNLKIAFELNGIFHYEPIFGEEKLKIIKKKDIEKINLCYEKGVDLISIDTTDSKRFNEARDAKYLNYIITEIEKYKDESR
jgi:hypothetical protein